MTLPGDIATEYGAEAMASVHLRILATSDLHAHLLPFDYFSDRRVPGIGLARLGTLIAAARAAAKNSILVDNGDTLQGAPLADAAVAEIVPSGRPHPMIAAMNGLGFDAATLGNHDFDYGVDHLEASMSAADFPIVLANAKRSDGSTFLPGSTMLERELEDSEGQRHRLRIGLIGVTPPQVADWNRAHLKGRLEFSDILPAVMAQVAALRGKGVDLVVVLAHSGLGSTIEPARAENVAQLISQMPGVDAVVAGHTHKVRPDHPPRPTSGVPIVQPGAFGSHLGCIDLSLLPPGQYGSAQTRWLIDRTRAGTFPILPEESKGQRRFQRLLADYPEIRSQLAREHRVTRAYVDKPLGESAVPLETYFSLIAPCAATQIVSDAQRAAAKPLIAAHKDVAHLPLLSAVAPFKAGGRGGALAYTDVPAGPLKLRHAADLYLYPNLLCVVRINGRGLRNWLERSASAFNRIDPSATQPQLLIDQDFAPYNFDRIDGLSYAIDVTQTALTDAEGVDLRDGPGRIRDLCFADGRPVGDEDEALVVTNSYRAAGGGHVHAAAAAETILTAQFTAREALADFITDQAGSLAPKANPTWRFAPMGGVEVVVETGPGSMQYADRAAALGMTLCHNCDHGLFAHPFTAYHMAL